MPGNVLIEVTTPAFSGSRVHAIADCIWEE